MSQFFVPGVRVAVRGEDFLIRNVLDFSVEGGARKDGHLLYVEGLSELVKGQQFIFDTSIDREVQVLNPLQTDLVADTQQGYRKLKLYLETQLRNAPVTSSKIVVAHKAAWDVTGFQLEPTLKSLQLPRPRMLIADGVGMGKTIEVGVFLSEMIRRGMGKRIMVLALKSILGQFQQELWSRFSIPLMRLDSTGIDRIKAELPLNKNPFDYYDRTIVSIDTLKNNAKFRRNIERSHWDIIVIDECHTVSNQSSQRGDLAQFLAGKCESLVLTSATPHNGKRESFANLIQMIEPTAIPRHGNYGKREVERYYVRRFKHHIQDAHVRGQFQEREVISHHVALSPKEEDLLALQQDIKFKSLNLGKQGHGDLLFSIGLFKGFLSSPEAMRATVKRRLEKVKVASDVGGAASDEALLEELHRRLDHLIKEHIDSKYDGLKSLLDSLRWKGRKSDERMVIFSERIDTLAYLERRLNEDYNLKPGVLQRFDGSLSDTEQQALVDDFGREDSDIRIFLSSDAGSQGVNLHFYCHRMVNYDIPWSLITLEQRNGRIDRYGQTQTPYIHYIIATSSTNGLRTDLHIIENLTEKEDEVHRTLGDVATVLKLYDATQEEEAVQRALINGDESFLENAGAVPGDEDEVDFDLLFGGLDDTTPAVEAAADAPLEEPLTLYGSDAAYYADLVSQLKSERQLKDHEARFEDATYLEVQQSDELRRVLYDMPPEAVPKERNEPFRLTFDPRLVANAISDARKRKGEWAKFQMMYDLHPIARYYMTKLEASVDKAMALVAEVKSLPYDTAWYVLHGQVGNGRGQSVISEFFVVPIGYTQGTLIEAPLPLREFVQRFRIDEPLYTLDITSTELEQLKEHLAMAVEMGTQMHMRPLQDAAKVRKEKELESYRQQLEAWSNEAQEQLQLAFAGSNQNPFAKHRLESGRREVETIVSASSQYYENLLALDKDPYLRVISVLFNHEAPRS